MKNVLLLLSLFFVGHGLSAQNKVLIHIVPDHSDWTYKAGETVAFRVSITGLNTNDCSVYYELGPEKMPPGKSGHLTGAPSDFVIDGGTLKTPGFLRCTVTVTAGNEKYSEIATAAFDPEKIKPTVQYPEDFNKFWNKTLADARKIPLDMNLTLLKERSTESYQVYQVDYHGYEYKNRSYGILTIPTKDGKFPAVIRFPGAGVHPLSEDASMAGKDVITLNLYIHPFPTQWDVSYYDSLRNSPYIDYKFWGVNDKDEYYYKRVIASCVRAVDVIYSLPQFDGNNLAAWGSSQGGALSIITASLDKRIKMLVALCPAMCDFTGYLHNRAGGWPHFFTRENIEIYNNKQVLETLPYYDVVNFARTVSVPGFYSWGFNDETTPPTSFYSAYNMINAPKKIKIIPEGKHRIYPEQVSSTYRWIEESFQN